MEVRPCKMKPKLSKVGIFIAVRFVSLWPVITIKILLEDSSDSSNSNDNVVHHQKTHFTNK